MSYNLHIGDCLEVLPTLEANSVDAIVCDPPYALKFMGKKWDYAIPSVEIWKECLRVLKPGGHLLSFGGTRTYHRLVVNIEDAGFEIRDTISWIYGSGFPKNLDISKAIDQMKGAEREVIGEYEFPDGKKRTALSKSHKNVTTPRIEGSKPHRDLTAPSTEEAKQFEGFGTSLKPAQELICLARKPLSEKNIASNVLLHGTGGLNIDGCRIEADWENDPSKRGFGHGFHKGTKYIENQNISFKEKESKWEPTKGRWPANVIHDGSDEVTRLFPNSDSRPVKPENIEKSGDLHNGMFAKSKVCSAFYDSGSAARFFYTAKASKSDRDEGLRGFAKKNVHRYQKGIGRNDGKDSDPNRPSFDKNNHPTVKPTSLMRYLVKLVTPPGGVVLDPFMGSGSTGKGAMLEGFSFVGIEMEEEYYKIAEARIKSAQSKGHQTTIF